MFKELLKGYIGTDELVGIFNDINNPNEWDVGRIVCVDDNWVVFQNMTSKGRYNGYKAILLDCIYRIETDGQYYDMLKTLYAKKKEQSNSYDFPMRIQKDVLKEMVDFSKNHEKMMSLSFDDDQVIYGWGLDAKDTYIYLQEIDIYGNEGGKMWVDAYELSEITIGDEQSEDNGIMQRSK